MPNGKSKILNKKKTLIIVLGVLLALLITLKSDLLFSMNVTTPVPRQDVSLNVDQDISFWIKNLKNVKAGFHQVINKIQEL